MKQPHAINFSDFSGSSWRRQSLVKYAAAQLRLEHLILTYIFSSGVWFWAEDESGVFPLIDIWEDIQKSDVPWKEWSAVRLP